MIKRTKGQLVRLSAMSVLIASGMAIAAPPATDAPLSGPSVQDRDVPGHTAKFGEMEDKRMRAARVPMRVFIGAIKMLDSQDAPADLRLTADQQEELKTIELELRETTRALARERGAERRTGGGGENGERPERGTRDRAPRPDAAESPDAPAKRDRARPDRRGPAATGAEGDGLAPERDRPQRRRAGRPGGPASETIEPQDMQDRETMRRDMAERMMNFEPPAEMEALRVRAWEVLNEPQQEFVRAEIDLKMEEIRAQREARQNDKADSPENAVKQERGQRGERARERVKNMSPEEILQRIEQLPPERREQALQRFRRYLEQQESADKPAPDMDEVDVPTP